MVSLKDVLEQWEKNPDTLVNDRIKQLDKLILIYPDNGIIDGLESFGFTARKNKREIEQNKNAFIFSEKEKLKMMITEEENIVDIDQ